jgi:hypothetical protein
MEVSKQSVSTRASITMQTNENKKTRTTPVQAHNVPEFELLGQRLHTELLIISLFR